MSKSTDEKQKPTKTEEPENKSQDKDPLAPPERHFETVDQMLPDKLAAIPLWKVSDEEMAEWELEKFVSSGMVASDLATFSHWVIGKLASNVEKSYGKDSLGQFANEINMSKSHVNQLRWVYNTYKDYEDTDLTIKPYWFYVAAAATDSPIDWVLQASNENWSVDKLKYEIQLAKNGGQTNGNSDQEQPPRLLKIAIPELKKYAVIDLSQAPKVKPNDEEYYEGEVSYRNIRDEDPLEGEVVDNDVQDEASDDDQDDL